MEGIEFSAEIQQWVNDALVWVGFGTLVGLLAKAIMPGRDPGGAVATLAMGVGGVVIGCGTFSYFYAGYRVTPISPPGVAVGTAGAFVILAFYRLLGGYWYGVDGHYRHRRHYRPRRRTRSRRRYRTAHYD